MKLADAHIHLFRHGYRRAGLPSLSGDRELESYDALRKIHGSELALAIGYEAEDIGPDNNAYIRQLSASRSWLKTLAYVNPRAELNTQAVHGLLDQGHRGLEGLARRHTIARVWPLFFEKYSILLMPVSWRKPAPSMRTSSRSRISKP